MEERPYPGSGGLGYASRVAAFAQHASQRRQDQREQAFADSVEEDFGEDFQLPINHRPTENLDDARTDVASMDIKIPATNLGYKLMERMGWRGQGLGKHEQGMTEPIKAGMRDAKLGVGKQEQDDFYTAPENVERKKLEVEVEETEEQLRKRQEGAEREERIRTEVKEIRKVFFCELCSKQYKLATEFEAHLSSYDHNHKKRFKEMARSQSAQADKDERQKREQKRQEKEMARLAQSMEAQRQQQLQRQQQQLSAPQAGVSQKAPATAAHGAGPSPEAPRAALKFGFGSKPTAVRLGGLLSKGRVATKVAAAFKADDSDEDG